MFDKKYCRLFNLLHVTLSNTLIDETLFLPISDPEWNEIIELAQYQGVTSIAFQALDKIKKDRPSIQLPDMEILINLSRPEIALHKKSKCYERRD